MNHHKNFILEIATSDYNTTAQAVQGGADRIELCCNLTEGGTTPSYGMIQTCRTDFAIPLYPIIRPRGGDFLYSDEEFAIMKKDVAFCKQTECNGVVIGILKKNGAIDKQRCAQLVQIAYPLKVTFHRAFDRCVDPFQALEDIIEIGCERILTSGLRPQALDGIQLLKELNTVANNRIIIMPGSGVRKENIKQLALETGCSEFHASLRGTTPSMMGYKNPFFEQQVESYFNGFIDSYAVSELKRVLWEVGNLIWE